MSDVTFGFFPVKYCFSLSLSRFNSVFSRFHVITSSFYLNKLRKKKQTEEIFEYENLTDEVEWLMSSVRTRNGRCRSFG